MEKNTKRLNDIILIRVFAIFIVVLGHSMIVYSSTWNTFELRVGSNFFNNLKIYIDVFQMPLFIFVSGYLYHFSRIELDRYKRKSRFIMNKFIRLLIPYFSVAILYVIPIRLLIEYKEYQGNNFLELIFNNVFLGNDIGHLWFLPTLFTIFILFYFFEHFISMLPFFLGTLFFIGVSVVSGFFPAIFFIQQTLNYLLYFYIGYKIRELVQNGKYRDNNLVFICLTIIQFVGIVFSVLTRNQDFILLNGMSIVLDKVGSLSSVLFFYFLLSKFSSNYPKITESKGIKYFDKESFQIYLFHSPLVYLTLYVIQEYTINPFLVVILNFLVCIVGSLLISKIVESLNVFNILIGKRKKYSGKIDTQSI